MLLGYEVSLELNRLNYEKRYTLPLKKSPLSWVFPAWTILILFIVNGVD